MWPLPPWLQTYNSMLESSSLLGSCGDEQVTVSLCLSHKLTLWRRFSRLGLLLELVVEGGEHVAVVVGRSEMSGGDHRDRSLSFDDGRGIVALLAAAISALPLPTLPHLHPFGMLPPISKRDPCTVGRPLPKRATGGDR